MKLIPTVLAAFTIAVGCTGFAAGAPAAASKPNLLLILSDDQGYGDVGVQGCKDFATPNLDAIARAGGYVTGAIGKWHLGVEEPFHPLNRGFTEFFGFLGGGHTYLPPASRAAAQRERQPLLRNREAK